MKATISRALYALVGLPILGVIAFATLRPIQVLPRIRLAPGFALADQDGARLTNEDLRGQVVLYNFTYTGCAAPCPPTSAVMRAVQDRLSEVDASGPPISLVTISFDPERDSPETLRAFAAEAGADPARWRFATGEATRLKYALGGGFGLYYALQPEGAFTFDPLFVLVDGWGIVRAEYRTATPEVDRLLRDIRLVITEARNSRGAAKYAYEAAHLFLCYPR